MAKLSQQLRDALAQAYKGKHDAGPEAGPGRQAIRNLLKDGLDAGLSEDQVEGFLNPPFLIAIADPYGRDGLIRRATPEQLHAWAAYAPTAVGKNATEAQSNFFDAFEDSRQLYIELAGESDE